ncbi:MAG: hypothetical protein U0869_24040 [Chloroflexota bacterium]
MSDLTVVTPSTPAYRAPALIALDEDAPRLEELFTFMADAELRVQTLRMRVEERTGTAKGEELSTIELVLAHPGRARITTRRSADPLSRDYRIWASDGQVVTTYDAMDERASIRPARPAPVGAADAGKPKFAQVYVARTPLPVSSVIDTMVHPHGLIRNVLLTGPVALIGTTHIAGGRETLVLRADHPRSSHVLTDRPDRWIEVGVDRMTGFISLLVEHVGDRVTRHAQLTGLETNGHIPDEAFAVNLPADVRMIY